MSAGFRAGNTRKSSLERCRIWTLNTYPAFLTLLIGIVLSVVLIRVTEQRLGPVLRTTALTQAENAVCAVMEQTVLSELEEIDLGYADLVSVERIQDGSVTAITTDMTAINRFRSGLMEQLLPKLRGIDRREIAVPIGSILGSKLWWGRGPTIKVRSFSVGTVQAEFESEFVSAGVNQTMHKIWLTLSAPTVVLLPGEQIEAEVQSRLCIAETVLIGKVADEPQKAYE